jgi:hypothetical protein
MARRADGDGLAAERIARLERIDRDQSEARRERRALLGRGGDQGLALPRPDLIETARTREFGPSHSSAPATIASIERRASESRKASNAASACASRAASGESPR